MTSPEQKKKESDVDFVLRFVKLKMAQAVEMAEKDFKRELTLYEKMLFKNGYVKGVETVCREIWKTK